MERAKTFLKFIGFGMKSQPWENVLNSRHLFSVRCYSDDSKQIQKKDMTARPKLRDILSHPSGVTFWSESAGIRRNKKKHSYFRKLDNIVDFANSLQLTKKWPVTPTEFYNFFKKRAVEKELLEQMYIPEREAALKADLAATHFLLKRGGSVKFVGRSDWVQRGSHIPFTYVPGYQVEAINAEGTNLYYEGLQNLSSLKYLSWLSLKGIPQINDWCLDWISMEYGKTLEHLDISDCKGVTYRGLSCFYRFEKLKSFEVSGVSELPEFKIACIMLQDLMPELEIKGIELSIPQKIDPINVEEVKHIQTQ